MIPKIIHYCWFGGKPFPSAVQKCIDSWKKYLPDYEIREWNETNYDLDKCKFAKEAYDQKKWAFVTDFVRLDVVYQYGGIYFDTDVEVIKSFDDLLNNKAFLGFDDDCMFNTGLGFGAEAGNEIIKKNRDMYLNMSFVLKNGELNLTTCPYITTQIIKRNGGILDNTFQSLEKVTLYPKDYFCPRNFYTGEIYITNNTHSIHQYSMSWLDGNDRKWHAREEKLTGYLGRKMAFIIVHGAKFIECFVEDWKASGAYEACRNRIRKIRRYKKISS